MATVRNLRGRGAKGVVEVHGEVLFLPGTDLSRWKNRFSHRVRTATAAAAPRNKRPRWGHYGKPLKSTMKAATRTRITKGGGFFYIGVGSTAPHAYYVDQGTGIFGGNGPYEAKILPPWQRGEASLYEHTWRPAGEGTRKVAKVMIKGQKGQHFFATGLKRGFQSMKMRSAQLPGEGVSAMSSALATFPSGLANFSGNTPADGAFIAELTQWRAWRDEAWVRDGWLGRRVGPRRRVLDGHDAEEMAENYYRYRKSIEASKRRAREQAAALKAIQDRKDAGRKKREAEEKKRRKAEKKARQKAAERRRKAALRQGNELMREARDAYYQRIKKTYPDADVYQTTLSDGVIVYQVRYTNKKGEIIRKRWAHGYST